VNRERRFANDANYLLNPNLAGIVNFKGGPNAKTAVVNGKHHRAQQRPVFPIEWAIYEYVSIVRRHPAFLTGFAAGSCGFSLT